VKHQKAQNFILGECQGNFHEKNSPNNNFLTVQPILACNILIDSARQAEKFESVKIFRIFILGEQWGNFQKIPP
jgi:hypothetical protein